MSSTARWIGVRRLAADLEEHAVAELEHIGLVHDGEMLAPLHRQPARRMRDALAAMARDPTQRDHDIRCDQHLAITLLHVAVGVKPFRVLAHHDEIEIASPAGQPRIGACGPDIGVEVEVLAKVPRRVDLAMGLVLEVEGRGRPEDQPVGGADDVEQLGAYRRAKLFEARMADCVLLQSQIELEAFGGRAQHA
ncbi:hypothetical protein ABIB66_000170 [Bradyrhizobium sp. F1.13.3]